MSWRTLSFPFILAALILSPQLAQSQIGQLPTAKRQAYLEKARLADEAYKIRRAALEERAEALGIPMRRQSERGLIELQGFNVRGFPMYYQSYNRSAAVTISTGQLYSWWTGGPYSYALSGSGVTLGEWDAGGVRTTHQEFGNRVTQIDSPPGLSSHATHVAGTLIAAGVDSLARGMSFAANLDAYDWNNDTVEMANAAAAGLLVSNHSYGLISGWHLDFGGWYWFGDTTVSTTEDYKFGFYGDIAQAWDQIAAQYPNYLICKAAGNDRNDVPSIQQPFKHYVWNGSVWTARYGVTRELDGGADGYDCIPDGGNAKNVLTVGAVNAIPGGWTQPSDVVISDFSGWGPTDDGRIKPDLVADGVDVFSANNLHDRSYDTKSGTSMATPSVAGSIGLLLEHQENMHPGTILRAATLKALLIHTVDEAGASPGPDYIHGWGLMNTHAAAILMSDNAGNGADNIHENSLSNSTTFELDVMSDGSPLKATICWTDPAGTSPSPSVNPTTPMLVNDLDLRIIGPSASTYAPWVLNPGSPASAATTGDNSRDNVEVVLIQNPVLGQWYKIRITHKGTIAAGAQPYSLIVTGHVTNFAPVADAGQDQTIDCAPPTGTPVTLDGSGSSDPDGDPLTYTWSEGSTIIAGPTTNPSSLVTMLPGTHVVTLTVDDGYGLSDTDVTNITLNPDVVPPVLTAPPSITESNDEGYCGAFLSSITLGIPIATDDCEVASVSNDAPSFLPVGVTDVTWTATDAAGNSATAIQSVTILDVEPPTIVASASPDVLWPPNHKLADITATVTVTDNCNADFVLYSITSNEPDNGLGDGDTPEDIQFAEIDNPDTQFKLRAERSGTGSGRVYTITYKATDDANNTAWATTTVVVPHGAPKSVTPFTTAPDALALMQNRPDPFNPSTVIAYRIPDDGNVRLVVYDYLGREITVLADLFQQKGTYEATFTARNVPSGLYFYRLEWNGQSRTRKMLLVK